MARNLRFAYPGVICHAKGAQSGSLYDTEQGTFNSFSAEEPEFHDPKAVQEVLARRVACE